MIKYIWLLIVISFSISGISYSQNPNILSISGKVRLLAGLELTTPIEAYVIIKSADKFANSDSLGQFRIDSLSPGTYKLSIQGFGYQETDTLINLTESIHDLDLLIFAECEINKDIAQRDIKKNEPRLLLSSGIAPVIYSDQEKFEKKYGVKYFDYGCVTQPSECIELYNKEIYTYLDNKFGKNWRREVRKDVVGFKRWK